MATNFFLKLEQPTIDGESSDSSHEKEIQVLSWNHSFSQPTSPTRSSAGAGTVEQANHSDFTIMKYTDAATDDLMKMCWSGKQIGKGTFTAYRSDGNNKAVKYLEVVMEKIVVSSVSIGGGAGNVSTESVSLNYGKVEYNYITQKAADGTGGGKQAISHDLVKQEVA